jgi:hypothetical protein
VKIVKDKKEIKDQIDCDDLVKDEGAVFLELIQSWSKQF